MEIVNAIRNYCEKEYYATGQYEIPFPLYFMTSITKLWEYDKISEHQGETIHTFLNLYYLKHYQPHEIPKLFSIVSCRFSDIDKGFKPYYVAVKYMEIYEKQYNANKLTELSILFDNANPNENCFKSVVCMAIGYCSIKKQNYKVGIPMVNSALNFLIKQNHKYSIFLSNHPIECILDFHKHDHNLCRKYQRRYKILAKYLLKYFKNYQEIEPTGRCYTLFALYYSHTCNQEGKVNEEKTKKYALKAIKCLERFMPFSKFLVEAYERLYVAQRSLCNFEECIAITKKEERFNEYHNNYGQGQKQIVKERFKELPELCKFIGNNKTYRRRYKQGTNLKLWQENRQLSENNISSSELNEWIEYVKCDKYYRIVRNICARKECKLCQAKNLKLFQCKQCRVVYYCSRKHQKIDWNMGHRNQCKPI